MKKNSLKPSWNQCEASLKWRINMSNGYRDPSLKAKNLTTLFIGYAKPNMMYNIYKKPI